MHVAQRVNALGKRVASDGLETTHCSADSGVEDTELIGGSCTE